MTLGYDQNNVSFVGVQMSWEAGISSNTPPETRGHTLTELLRNSGNSTTSAHRLLSRTRHGACVGGGCGARRAGARRKEEEEPGAPR